LTLTREEQVNADLDWCFYSFAEPFDILTAMDERRAREHRRRQGGE